jgi:hypothetical protein
VASDSPLLPRDYRGIWGFGRLHTGTLSREPNPDWVGPQLFDGTSTAMLAWCKRCTMCEWLIALTNDRFLFGTSAFLCVR